MFTVKKQPPLTDVYCVAVEETERLFLHSFCCFNSPVLVLQAHPSLCSQRGPTWPCLLSSPTATATQQHRATASPHSPASVTACEHPTPPPTTLPHPPRLGPTPSLHLSSLSVFLTSFLWSSTHNRGHKAKQQPTLVLSTIFLLRRLVIRENI